MGVAYKVTSPSGKSYVGITSKSFSERWSKHVYDARAKRGTAIGAAIRKYGPEAFSVEILVQADMEYLSELEPKLIVLYGTRRPDGYNISGGGWGGDHMTGRTHSQETREKMSQSQKTRCKACSAKDWSTSAKKAWANSSDERRQQLPTLTCSKTPQQLSASAKKAWANSSPDRRSTQRSKMKALFDDPEWRSAWMKKQTAARNAKTSEQRSESAKKAWTAARRKKHAETMTTYWADPKYKKSCSQAISAGRRHKENPHGH